MEQLMRLLENQVGGTGGTGAQMLLGSSRDSVDPADLLKASVSTHSVLASLVDRQILATYRKQDFVWKNPERFEREEKDSLGNPLNSISDVSVMKASTNTTAGPFKLSIDGDMNMSTSRLDNRPANSIAVNSRPAASVEIG